LEDLDVDGRIILKWTFKAFVARSWTDLSQDKKKWRAVVKAVMNFRLTKKMRYY
jgi:hypothetical protein